MSKNMTPSCYIWLLQLSNRLRPNFNPLKSPPQPLTHPLRPRPPLITIRPHMHQLAHGFYALHALLKDAHLVRHARLAQLVDAQSHLGDGRVGYGRDEVCVGVGDEGCFCGCGRGEACVFDAVVVYDGVNTRRNE